LFAFFGAGEPDLGAGGGLALAAEARSRSIRANMIPISGIILSSHRELRQRYGIEFTSLFTITNQPIARFAEDLRSQGQWAEYLELLANNFNPATVEGLMCRSTLSVGWR
jgi:hypothetical protein